VLVCFHVVVKIYRYSLEEPVFIVKAYWITGSIKNCQRFVEKVWWPKPAVETLHSTFSEKVYLILSFRITDFLFANSQNTQPHFIAGMTCKCIAFFFFL
jgi:hypothetical protein